MSHLSEQDLTPGTKKPDSIAKREKYIAEVEKQLTDVHTVLFAVKENLELYKVQQDIAEAHKSDQHGHIWKQNAIDTWQLHLELTRLLFTKISDLGLDTNDLQMNGHPFGF